MPSPVDEHPTELPATRTIVDNTEGAATIAAYSVEHTRQGQSALAICDTASGQRCYARADDPDLLARMQKEEWVGKKIELRNNNNVNIFSE